MVDHEKEDHWQNLRERLSNPPPTMPAELLHLARAVVEVNDPNMECEECQDWLPSYVDNEVGGLPIEGMYLQIKHHLDFCQACEPIYLQMLELALAEEAGELPVLAQSPMPDLSFLPPVSQPISSLQEYVEMLTEILVKTTVPHLLDQFEMIKELIDFEQLKALGKNLNLKASSSSIAFGFGGGGEPPETLRLLVTTFTAIQSLTEQFSAAEIETQASTDQLSEILRQQGERAAQQVGLNPQQVHDFAEQFATLASRDPTALQALLQLSD